MSATEPVRLLLTRAAHARLADDLAAFEQAISVTAIDLDDAAGDGTARPPHIAYLTGDLLRSARLPRVTALMQAGSGRRWAHSCAAGTDGPAFAALMMAGVELTKSDAQAPAIADYVLCQTLALLHPIAEAHAAQIAGMWQRLTFCEIADTSWLIVGFGAIGTEIARRLRAFGATISAIRRDPAPHPLADRILPPASVREALPHADVVILSCPLTDDTRGMADNGFFARMKPGAILVNVGRGALIDDAALLAGLDAGRPAAAILDVFHQEPLPQASPFWKHPAVRLTAHGAGAGSGVVARNDLCFLDNLERYFRGDALIGTVAPLRPDRLREVASS